ncbi:helix-turn-helix domain-containing protein [uncultured Desulfosarcina sp.]|uniref:helix-turn-helix domain-containing protein n=1 Tax=uncultured Desulfosarcina sp. TaxID=218289 RepID=UPI003748808B
MSGNGHQPDAFGSVAESGDRGHAQGKVLDLATLELPEDGLDLETLAMGLIHKALDKFNGNKSQAAAYLGMSRYALYRKLQKDDE